MDFVNINSKPKVYIGKSKIVNGGEGLFAKKFIHKGTNVVIYYGDKVSDEEIYKLYVEKPKEYYELQKIIRGTPNGFAIKGDKEQINLNLCGVYVNDVASINCTKYELDRDVLQKYANTVKKCNVKTVDTKNYPVYISSRKIKKGEELYAHYGIGYWLSHIGCTPEEISDLNQKYLFNSFYS